MPATATAAPPSVPDVLEETSDLEATSVWTDDLVAGARIPIVDVPLVTIGGGLGSFTLVDVLRIAGAGTDRIGVVTPSPVPYETYEHLARNSQISASDRLRSDAGSVVDNIWGFPSYAWREAWSDRSLRPLWQVATEPVLSEYFTPRAGQVYRSVERETARIGWDRMVVRGLATVVRRRRAGGYFVLVRPSAGGRSRTALRCSHAHLAVGYPGVRFLPDLQVFRAEHDAHAHLVVNAYEAHEHVYTAAARRPVTLLLRGSGIVASRVLERLLSDHERHGAPTRVLHLFRTYVAEPQGSRPWFRRPAGGGFAYQAFNFPKAAWGGQLRDRLAALEGDERAALLDQLGGTTTAPRKDWQRQREAAERSGAYRQLVGTVTEQRPGPGGDSVLTAIRAPDGTVSTVLADYVIDATGLLADMSEHRLHADLLAHSGATRNPKGRLDVAPTFEIRGTRSGEGRLYASGAMTLGGYHAGVDSFLGLQYAATQIADDLADIGFVPRLGIARSIRQWWRWARDREV